MASCEAEPERHPLRSQLIAGRRRCSAPGELDRGPAARLRPARAGSSRLPPARAVHHLLGGSAVKEGEGGTALDHFCQVRSGPRAAGAGGRVLSLIGDDAARPPALGAGGPADAGSDRAPRVGGGAPPRGEMPARLARCPASTWPRPTSAPSGCSSSGGPTRRRRASGEECAGPQAVRRAGLRRRLRLCPGRRHPLTRCACWSGARELGYSDRRSAASDPDLAPLHGAAGASRSGSRPSRKSARVLTGP